MINKRTGVAKVAPDKMSSATLICESESALYLFSVAATEIAVGRLVLTGRPFCRPSL